MVNIIVIHNWFSPSLILLDRDFNHNTFRQLKLLILIIIAKTRLLKTLLRRQRMDHFEFIVDEWISCFFCLNDLIWHLVEKVNCLCSTFQSAWVVKIFHFLHFLFHFVKVDVHYWPHVLIIIKLENLHFLMFTVIAINLNGTFFGKSIFFNLFGLILCFIIVLIKIFSGTIGNCF